MIDDIVHMDMELLVEDLLIGLVEVEEMDKDYLFKRIQLEIIEKKNKLGRKDL